MVRTMFPIYPDDYMKLSFQVLVEATFLTSYLPLVGSQSNDFCPVQCSLETVSRIQIELLSYILQEGLSDRGWISYQIMRSGSLEDFAAEHMTITNVLNVLEQGRLGLAMDWAGLAFVPKSVLDYQHLKVIACQVQFYQASFVLMIFDKDWCKGFWYYNYRGISFFDAGQVVIPLEAKCWQKCSILLGVWHMSRKLWEYN